ncbi:MAG: type II toxin-antitoxin system RelE/ParE family toxin [Terricaulis sp.]|nr:type II toxin-antitoxin system RelE/ParE family toxin [Terricaulis sp.]
MKIEWEPRAQRDLKAILDYILKESPSGAARVHDQILHSVSFLADWPDMGRQGRRPNLRELVIPRTPYIVIYRRADALVSIVRVIHGRRLH